MLMARGATSNVENTPPVMQ